jgi:hypothetical protein
MARTIDFEQWLADLDENRRRSREFLAGLDLTRFPRRRPRSADEERWLREGDPHEEEPRPEPGAAIPDKPPPED